MFVADVGQALIDFVHKRQDDDPGRVIKFKTATTIAITSTSMSTTTLKATTTASTAAATVLMHIQEVQKISITVR